MGADAPADPEATRQHPAVDPSSVRTPRPEEPERPELEPRQARPGPERREDVDPASLTTEMEPINEEIQKRRAVDHTLARFSAVHDELAEEERQRRDKRRKLQRFLRFLPWFSDDDDDWDSLGAEPIGEADNDDADDPQVAEQREKHRRRRHQIELGAKVGAIAAAGVVFLATGVGWGAIKLVDHKFQQVAALDENSSAILERDRQYNDENFLLVGSDSRAGATSSEGVGTANQVEGARSDTVMVAHIPADRKRVVVVSFPRDLEVDRPACEAWDSKTNRYTGKQVAVAKAVKLNTAYEVGGPRCVTKLVQQLSGLRINHFVGIDFQGFKTMVDAVSGVEICVARPIRDDELGVVIPNAGRQTISGDAALSFVRARKVQGELKTDYERIQRQQRFLSALLRRAMSGQVLLDPAKMNRFLNAFASATFGENISVDQLLPLAQSLQGLDPGRVSFLTMPHQTQESGTGDSKVFHELPDLGDAKKLFQAIIDGTPLAGEGATPPNGQQAPPAAPTGDNSGDGGQHPMKIQVLNGGSTKSRIATTTADALRKQGFEVVRVDNAPEQVPHTLIRFGAPGQAVARALAAAVPGATLQQDPSMGGAVVLTLGPEFDGKVVTPTSPSSASGQAQGQPSEPGNVSAVNGADASCTS
jgi:LCP family protein required for cell wall assembly